MEPSVLRDLSCGCLGDPMSCWNQTQVRDVQGGVSGLILKGPVPRGSGAPSIWQELSLQLPGSSSSSTACCGLQVEPGAGGWAAACAAGSSLPISGLGGTTGTGCPLLSPGADAGFCSRSRKSPMPWASARAFLWGRDWKEPLSQELVCGWRQVGWRVLGQKARDKEGRRQVGETAQLAEHKRHVQEARIQPQLHTVP